MGIFRDTYETEKGRHTELISWFCKGYKSVKVVTTPLQQLLQSCFVFASRLWRLPYQRWVGWEYNTFLHISIHRRRNFSIFELKQKEKAGQQTCHDKRSLQINWESKGWHEYLLCKNQMYLWYLHYAYFSVMNLQTLWL